MLLMLLWIAWNLWLTCCFWDHLFWPASSWENEKYKYDDKTSHNGHIEFREGECHTITTPRKCRSCHLKLFSYICCSKRSPLECVECKFEKLWNERKAKGNLLYRRDNFLKADAKDVKEWEKIAHDQASVDHAQALKKLKSISEGARIGSGRILCDKHLQDYYIHKPQRIQIFWLWQLHNWCICILCCCQRSNQRIYILKGL